MHKLISIVITLSLASFIFSCKPNDDPAARVAISGEIKDYPDGVMTLYRVYDEDSTIIDTARIKGGVFSFDIKDKQTRLATLAFPDGMSAIQMFTEPGNIHIKADRDEVTKAEVTGTATNQLNEEFKKINSTIESKYNELMQIGSAAQESGNAKTVDSVTSLLINIEKETNTKNIEFAKKNPTSMLSAYIGLMAGSSGGGDQDLSGLYALLSEDVKNSFFGTRLKSLVDASAKTALGAIAPEFEGLTPDGKILKLSSLKGKHVLVDFWASWCAPCRQENPNMVKTFEEFNKKGFEVLGVSLDQEKDKWISAIAQDNLTWSHVSDLKGWKSAIAAMYGVQGIPQNFLLDQNGKIIAKGLRGDALALKLKELLN